MSAFRVGQKVVCVGKPAGYRPLPSERADNSGACLPSKGQIYAVRSIVFTASGSELLLLVEVVNKPQRGFEPGFSSSIFRPLAYPSQSLEHDVALFQRGHVSVPIKEPTA